MVSTLHLDSPGSPILTLLTSTLWFVYEKREMGPSGTISYLHTLVLCSYFLEHLSIKPILNLSDDKCPCFRLTQDSYVSLWLAWLLVLASNHKVGFNVPSALYYGSTTNLHRSPIPHQKNGVFIIIIVLISGDSLR